MELKKWMEWLEHFPSQELANLYQKWLSEKSPLKEFLSPKELVLFLHTRKESVYAIQDKILHSLVSEFQETKQPSLLSIYLFIILFPFVEHVYAYWRKRILQNERENDEMRHDTYVAFCNALQEIDIKRIQTRIGLYFQHRVKTELEKLYRHIINRRKYEINLVEELYSPYLLESYRKSEYDIYSGNVMEGFSMILGNFVRKKYIDSQDKHLIIETRLRKKPLAVVARRLHMAYFAAAKKRRRAEEKVIALLEGK